jgi:hypothetical protein
VLELTAQEQKDLKTLEGKLTHMKDAVRGVVKGFYTGLVLWGEGGTGKSYTVVRELKAQKAKYTHHNTRITGRGLVDALQRSPSDIHLIEDADTLLDDKRAWGVLRSALWSQSKKKPPRRMVTWTAFNTSLRFVFTGGIIIVGNTNIIQTRGELRALKSRISVLHLDVSNNEIRALMKQICQEGHSYGEDYLSPDECWEVTAFVIGRLEELQRGLDLRLLVNGFHDYLQWKTGNSNLHWHVLLEGRMKEEIVYVGRAEQKARQTRLALEIHQQDLSTKEKIALWTEKTGLSQQAYYRALWRAQAK